MTIGPVHIPETVSYILMAKGGDIASAESKLKGYHDITVLNRFGNIGALLVESPVAAFRKYWGTNIRYSKEMVDTIPPGHGQRTVYNWRMTGRPVIKKELEDVITSIAINNEY